MRSAESGCGRMRLLDGGCEWSDEASDSLQPRCGLAPGQSTSATQVQLAHSLRGKRMRASCNTRS